MVRKIASWLLVGSLACWVFAGVEAKAGWGGSWGGSFGGSYGSYGSGGSYGSWGDSYGSVGASHGSVGASHGSAGASYGSQGSWRSRHQGGLLHRLFHRVHTRRAARWGASHGSWGGSSGGWGSSGGSYGSAGYASSGYASGGSHGGWTAPVADPCCDGCAGGNVIDGGVIVEPGRPLPPGGELEGPPPVPQQQQQQQDAGDDQARRTNAGYLTVSVPTDAQIFVNGTATRSNGALRRYVSKGLRPGQSYRYVVRAQWEQDGKTLEQTRVATLRAGQSEHLAFDFNRSELETRVTLQVPEDAEVYLAGNKTVSTGPVRTFATTRLDNGDAWSDYTVRVSVNRNGQTMTKERTLTLNAGDQVTLDFDFLDHQLADAR